MILKTDLYDHQKKAIEKLSKIKIGALYMEMGTGKTRTVLELAIRRIEKEKIEHVLWLCPCSVKESLRRELLKHIDDISFITICGIETLSSSIRENSRLLNLVKSKKCFLIIDESNLIKNFFAKRTKAIINLAEHCHYRAILNGTPISRDEADLFSQWYLLDWRILGYKSYWSFSANHLEFDENRPGRHVRVLNTEYIMRKIAPYSYQVRKSECLDLPPKSYSTVWYELTDDQRQHYYTVFDVMLDQLDELEPTTIYRLLSSLQAVTSGYYLSFIGFDKNHRPSRSSDIQVRKRRFYDDYTKEPRLHALERVIDRIIYDDKVIIFAKYTDEINMIADHLNNNYGKAVKFNGEMTLKQRQESIDAFERDAQFLVANKQTAGYGLNLQFCNYIIYYSNDWDWGTREQSEDRVHRIGQTKNVHIVDIAAERTIDERILANLAKKTNLVDDLKNELNKLKDRHDFAKTLEEYLHDGENERKEIRRKRARGEHKKRKY